MRIVTFFSKHLIFANEFTKRHKKTQRARNRVPMVKVSAVDIFCSLGQLSIAKCNVAIYLADDAGMDCEEWEIVAYELVIIRAPCDVHVIIAL